MELKLAQDILDLDVTRLMLILESFRMQERDAYEVLKELVEDG